MQVADVEPADSLPATSSSRCSRRRRGSSGRRPSRRPVAGAGQDDRADVEVVAGLREGVAELGEGRRPERVAPLGPVDRDLRDPVAVVVEDVLVVAGALPFDRGVEVVFGRCVLVAFGHLLAVFEGAGRNRRNNVGNDNHQRSGPVSDPKPSSVTKHAPTGSTTAPASTRRRSPVADAGETLDYAELRAEAGAVAAALADVGRRHRATRSRSTCRRACRTPSPCTARSSPGRSSSRCRPAGRDGVDVAPGAALRRRRLGSREARGRGRRVERPVAAIRRATLTRVLSSGTSGAPKPVELTAANHAWSALARRAQPRGRARSDRWLCCLPLNHVGGLTILLRSAIYGTGCVIHDGFDVDGSRRRWRRAGRASSRWSPPQLVRLLDAGAAVDSPRLLLLGGGPVPRTLLDEALGRGAVVVQTYGLTEACSQVCTLPPAEARARAGSAGRPLLRDRGARSRRARSSSADRPSRRARVAPDGWLHTGDLGRLDDEGYLWVEGRRGDLIVTGGENVRPQRVEEALRAASRRGRRRGRRPGRP